jgi:uncharacterized protein with ATP-grasp and redox domains
MKERLCYYGEMMTNLVQVRTDQSNPFAYHTMRVRIPALIQETIDLNPDYPPQISDALKRLADDLANNAQIPMLSLPAPDYDEWVGHYANYAGNTWLGTDWFFGEIFMYRHFIEAVRWWETGRDPFKPKKNEEFNSAAMREALEKALAVPTADQDERLSALIEFSLWGNRIDLSYALVMSHGAATMDDLLVDEHEPVVQHLLAQPGTVHMIADNAGTELAMDLALADGLLDSGTAPQVIYHVKLHPTYVSDTTAPDVLWLLDLLSAGKYGDAGRGLGNRLTEAFYDGRLKIAPDGFWNMPRFLNDLPARLQKTFEDARLVIVKGDANYRRTVLDVIWPTTTRLTEVIKGFPAPLLALRTLKSDPVVGLPAGMDERLDAEDSQWRVNGKRGIIQTTLV